MTLMPRIATNLMHADFDKSHESVLLSLCQLCIYNNQVNISFQLVF